MPDSILRQAGRRSADRWAGPRTHKTTLDKNKIKGNKTSEFDYDEITGKIISANLNIQYENIEIMAKIDWIEEMEYPLMFIEHIHEIE